MKKLSLIISVYNEEAVLEKFYKAFCSIEQNLEYGGGGYELIFVNDGSTDASMNILEVIAQQNKNVRVISFSRNFREGKSPCLCRTFRGRSRGSGAAVKQGER